MNKNYQFGIGMVLAVLMVFAVSSAAALPIPPGKNAIVWLEPDPSSASPGQNITVQLKVNTSQYIYGYATWIYFDPNHVDITKADRTGSPFTSETVWSHWGNYVKVAGSDPDLCEETYGEMLLATLTLQGKNPGTSQLYHSNTEMLECINVDPIPTKWVHGNFTSVAPTETFTKSLPAGWNLISLPLTPTNNSTSAVLGNATIAYDAVKRYDATTKTFADAAAMDPGTGYFVHVTTAGTWEYEGTPVSSTSPGLKSGLNMIGVPNCTMDVSIAMGSAEYRYAARWNATVQNYEVYNPSAPSAFYGFTTMTAGEGYFVSAKTDNGGFSISCPS